MCTPLTLPEKGLGGRNLSRDSEGPESFVESHFLTKETLNTDL